MHILVTMDTPIPSCDPPSPVPPWNVSSSVSLNSNHHDSIDGTSLSNHGDHDVSCYGNQNGSNHIYHGDKIRIDEYLCTKDHGTVRKGKTDSQTSDQNGSAIYNPEHELKPRARSASQPWDVLLRKAGFGLQSLRKSAQIRRPLPMPIFKDSKNGSKMEYKKDTSSNLDIIIPRPSGNCMDTLDPLDKGRTIGFVKPMYRAPVSVQYVKSNGKNGITSPKPGQDAHLNTKNAWARLVGRRPTKPTTQAGKQLGWEKMAGKNGVCDQ
ncbi:hypothetical protein KP79_PYT10945 [Mizuhopecten yessoensis]|uniref:Uncharacterized protein n=2 Tax=Mizuhopecten yessoensis TaxID=6573 RepID=A0A210PF42_MIZYE|nr:hypothetical protein KP79_PYT10945 [Mizuhopecten yessoensis]